MRIFGQDRIIKEMVCLLNDVKSGRNYSILLRAASGQGKTTIALSFLYNCGYEIGEYIPCEKGKNPVINKNKRVHLLDEAHEIEEPEFLYPIMDEGKNTFLICTNLSGSLKEPFRNRCIELIFDPYTEDDISKIVKSVSKFQDWMIPKIVSASKLNPRIAKVTATRLESIFRNNGEPKNEEELDKIMESILGIRNSLNINDQKYLTVLKIVGRSSLANIRTMTGIDEDTIKYEIEPYLLYNGNIKITSRGREFIKE